MKTDDWKKAKEIFGDAIKIAPAERASFLDEVCDDDKTVRREVESLLSSYDDAESFMENPAVGEVAEIVVKENLENETLRIDTPNETAENEEELAEAPDENALRPSRLRFALVCLFFAFVVGWSVINFVQQFSFVSNSPEWKKEWKDKRFIIASVMPDFADQIKVGDELVSINNEPVNIRNFWIVHERIKPGERYTLQLKREGEAELRQVELVAHSRLANSNDVFEFYFFIILSAIFLFAGLAIFLLKSNNKQVLLVAVFFASWGVTYMQRAPGYTIDLPLFFAFWWRAGFVVFALGTPLMLHLALGFPKRSRIVRRFPNLERLIYLPALLTFVPQELLVQLYYEGWSQFDIFQYPYFSFVVRFTSVFYICAILAILLLNYLRADEAGKRRIRLIVVGFAFGLTPLLTVMLFGLLFNINLWKKMSPWLNTLIYSLNVIMPLAVAYAILRHKVIPISFVIRRGLQYLLAKNALRLMLVLPILGIIWNIAANPNRTLSEILLNNSFAFYSFLALAAGFFLLMRSRFSNWIDRRFFREQYNQEKILRELIDEVKQFDSMPKLSRFVSSRIQSALHPTSVYLFYRDDEMNSGFSLGYTTSGAGESSANLKLAAESPLLRFMQQERGAIEFPASRTDDLPSREKRWLRETGANVLVPMHGTDGKLAGIFTLGEKMSQIPYTTRDKELLETLANQIALVHENLNLKDRVRREQKIKTEVLSRFDQADINLLKECPKCGRCFDRNTEKCDEDNSELTFSLPVTRTIENRYRLEKLLGKGGMGAVYQATDTRINRQVAVKILSGAMFGNKDALRRFEREAQTAGKLNHRNIVTVFDYGILSTEGAFLVMELVRGETLSEVLKRKGKLDAKTVVAWFSQVLDGVEAAHKAGIIHRDLKPDNIFVTRCSEDETVRLCILDFGLARFNELEFTDSVTVPGTIMGTLGYMPPEQLRGEKTDERSDLFATSVIIYEALHGEKPFAGKSYQEIMRSMSKKIVFDEDETFTKFFERGLAQKPEKRFASANEMKGNLSNSSFILKTI